MTTTNEQGTAVSHVTARRKETDMTYATLRKMLLEALELPTNVPLEVPTLLNLFATEAFLEPEKFNMHLKTEVRYQLARLNAGRLLDVSDAEKR